MRNTILCGDALEKLRELPDSSVHMCVTSPPYFSLRDYGNDKQIGLEETPEEYVAKLVEVFHEVKRVLRVDGTLWLVIGDSYASNGIYIGKYKETHPEHTDLHIEDSERYPQKRKGVRGGEYNIKAKDLLGIPWLVAFALRNDGWYIRRDIIWAKSVSFCHSYSGSCMPEPVRDRPTSSHEYVFILSKSARYFYDREAYKERHSEKSLNRYKYGLNAKQANSKSVIGSHMKSGIFKSNSVGDFINPSGRNLRSVWTVNPKPYPDAHFAVYPPKLIEPMIKLGTSEYGCCPTCGAPWVRHIIKGESDEAWKKSCGADSTGEYNGESKKFNKQDALGKNTYTGFNARWKAKQQNASDVKRNVLEGLRKTTYEWKPSCTCGCTDTLPCIVLDPFAGSGTTGVVARDLGRDYVLIELSEEYVKNHIRKRLRLDESISGFL